jgi:hypothetical protein
VASAGSELEKQIVGLTELIERGVREARAIAFCALTLANSLTAP